MAGELVINDRHGRRPPGIAVVHVVSVVSVFQHDPRLPPKHSTSLACVARIA